MTRYTMSARSQGIHRWVFAHGLDPDVETLVRKWLTIRLVGFYCDLQVAYTPRPIGPIGPTQARTHIVLNNAPPLHAMAEVVEVDAHGLTPTDAAKAVIKATGLSPHMSVCGWPFCLADLDGVDSMEGGAA